MIKDFDEVCNKCSKITAEQYSTSFSRAIKLLHRDLRSPIYSIYGFVRFADEIVDTFHQYNKQELLREFKSATYKALNEGISLNPVLYSFQHTASKYNIEHRLIDAFFNSMEQDLVSTKHSPETYRNYIYGSAEVVGLMCLSVFCEGNSEKYLQLKDAAQSLGAAFQKVNFLRDMQNDFHHLNRMYFPGVDFNNFTLQEKQKVEAEVAADFCKAYQGIMQLPVKARFGVYVAYLYYFSLFKKIQKSNPEKLLQSRIRIPNYSKALIVFSAGFKKQFNLL
ncbi:MAG TPA: phytoene/squalene synthase family protein [Ferruginibacter sp.]|nr:phytoene/squalene synthase family protein [Chitinophagaceae bacterium]HMT95774.1 phytoene/squalene synthase family protein [Ferruginibacter sp.]HMU23478.1 phytoene/squalene synthase family protein [Ferruginibacter sp.]